MKRQSKHNKAMRDKLIDGIEKCIVELGVTKIEAAKKVDVTVQTLHNNLSDKLCLNNIDFLTRVLEILTTWLTEKRENSNKKVTELLHKIDAA